ncbi:related to sorting nexin 4 [Cephalotrichum gorgonifer]|uniref:Sorting nexin-4 n=1 Tax=Cephalotrichum gorgonifer TaxID=2041049 RepID=A0AAE8N991_9PEZI|nr:related to sorting nexin 4 [Cephalotrichum gorgonifer]
MAVVDQDNFSNVSWHSQQGDLDAGSSSRTNGPMEEEANNGVSAESGVRREEIGAHSLGPELLECTVTSPIKENDGTKDAFVSYLITTQVSIFSYRPVKACLFRIRPSFLTALQSTFPSFQKPVTTVRRRFTDFVFLYKSLTKDYIACAVPPLPDKQRMEYVRGDRFGSDFTARRAYSLQRFLARLALHPVLRRAPMLHTFLESSEWNATMRSRTTRASSHSEAGSGGVFDNFADTFINAFTKVHKPDKRFTDVKEKSDKLDEDLSHIEKVIARVIRRESDLETDFKDLAEQFQKLISLEPGVEGPLRSFSTSVEDTSAGLRRLKDTTDQDYLGSLRDMQAYSLSLKNLLKAREQKQLDYEQLTEYLNKSTVERDSLRSASASSSYYGSGGGITGGASGFLRSKLEDVRGVDHEQARRERQRKLELRIEELTREVEEAKRMSEMFDDEVVRETVDFERIKKAEMRDEFRGLADAHVGFYEGCIEVWEAYVKEMEREGTLPT